jgi:hypothetical protein
MDILIMIESWFRFEPDAVARRRGGIRCAAKMMWAMKAF